jgi:hypothetical protein
MPNIWRAYHLRSRHYYSFRSRHCYFLRRRHYYSFRSRHCYFLRSRYYYFLRSRHCYSLRSRRCHYGWWGGSQRILLKVSICLTYGELITSGTGAAAISCVGK